MTNSGIFLENDGEKHKPFLIPRPKITDHQVKFEMLYCGICHTDVHHGRNEWGPGNFPIVAGHELLGKVTEVGEKVTKFKVRKLLFMQFVSFPCTRKCFY